MAAAKPLVPPKSGVSKLFTMRRTVDFEAALERALAALAAAGEEVPMKGGEVVVSALVVAGLNVLAERAEGVLGGERVRFASNRRAATIDA